MDDQVARATVYQGTTVLLSWTHNDKGRKVVLELDPTIGDLHPFSAIKTGSRLMVVAVAIAEDEAPQPVRTQAEPRRAPADPDRVKLAGILCSDRTFQIWMQKRYPEIWGLAPIGEEENSTARTLRNALGIESRKELKTDLLAQEKFDRLRDTFIVEARWGRS